MKRALLGCLLAAAAGASLAAQKATPREPIGYRMDDYGALVPATLKGASVLSTTKAFELWSQKAAVFVDVLPRPPKPAGLPKEAVWRDAPRQDIPGSVWLPDTGYGELAAPTQHYFEDGLSRATHDDKSKAACVLLPQELLDVLERGQARAVDWLHQCFLVSRRRRWLGRGGKIVGISRARASRIGAVTIWRAPFVDAPFEEIR